MWKQCLGGVMGGVVAGLLMWLVVQPRQVSVTWNLPPTSGPAPAPVLQIDALGRYSVVPEAYPRPATRPSVPDPLLRTLEEVSFKGVALAEVVDWLREVTGGNVVVNWRALEAAGIDRAAPVSLELRRVPADRVLRLVLHDVGGRTATRLAFRVEDGVVTISTADELGAGVCWRMYDVRDLIIEPLRFSRALALPPTSQQTAGCFGLPQVYPGASEGDLGDQLVAIIEDAIAPETWRDNGGTTGSIRYWAGRLVVGQTAELQEKVAELLTMLRTGQGQVESGR